MENKLNIILLVAAILFAAAFGYLLNQVLNKPEIVSVPSPYPVLIPGKDSVIVHHHYYYNNIQDSLKAEVKNDTAKTEISTQQIFDQDTLKAQTNVEYHLRDSTFSIAQSFNLIKTKTIRIDTLKIYEQKIVEVPEVKGFFDKPYVNFILGVIASVALFLLGGGG